MTTKRILACAALTVACAFPAAASAQAPIDPPASDHYLDGWPVSDFRNPGRFPGSEIGFIADTTNYTVQEDLFNPPSVGGGPEPNQCGTSVYGNTIWLMFYADRFGVMNISTAGPFDSVIGVVPFNSPEDAAPDISNGLCYDGLRGFEEESTFLAVRRQWYAVQVGGTGETQGGPVQVKFNFDPPPRVSGEAFLTYDVGPLRVTRLQVKQLQVGQTVGIRCTKGACRKRTVNVGRGLAASSFDQVIQAERNAITAGISDSPLRRLSEARSSKSAGVHAAQRPRTVTLLKNRKVKRGAKIEVRIKRPGFIGKFVRWKVRKNSLERVKETCMNPNSNRPRKKCTG